MQRKTSNSNLPGRLGRLSNKNPRTLNLQLALNQANEELREANAQRRAVDAKTITILSVTLVLVGFLVSLRPWAFVKLTGLVFFALALVVYALVIGVGLRSYFPREFRATKTRAITRNLDRPNEMLAEWTLESLLDFADEIWRIASEKGYWLQLSMILLLMATLLLGISLVPVP
ncbi:hypothetical protein MUP07_01755 [Candidatus Bathyarchaeota archaeon]|nr:hypothetical protein [Candidatus Bathyarchaeota archaeon]